MKPIFLVSQSNAGNAAICKILSAALGDDLRICDHASAHDCCRSTPCKRANEFERAGYLLQLHTGHGFSASSERSPNGTCLVLTEEPTIAAFGRYEEALRNEGRSHSVEFLHYRLAQDAVSRIDHWRSWTGGVQPDVVAMRVEDFIEAARSSVRKLLSAASVEFDDRALDAAELAAAALPQPADVKSLETNAHFARPCFLEYMNLLCAEANYFGYSPWQELKMPSGPVTTIYRALRAMKDKNYEEVVVLLASFAGTSAVDRQVRAMLGRALLETGREMDGRRALEVVLRVEPDYFEGYTILAEHAYETGLNVEARGYLREAAARPHGASHVGAFLAHTNIDPDLARDFAQPQPPEAPPLPLGRESVISGFQWILGRVPESEDVITDHRRLANEEALRSALLQSQEFKEFFERFDAAHFAMDAEQGEPVSRDDIIGALRWILGRSLQSRAEADELLDLRSRNELRHRLVGAEEFKQSYRRAA